MSRDVNEVPDTTEAVVAEVYRNQHVWSAGGDSLAGAIARYAVSAHRKALSDAGWVEAPKVKINSVQLIQQLANQNKHPSEIAGWENAIRHLQSLGLPIELED